MKLPKFKKKVMAVGIAGGMAIGAGGIAAAFLTATASGTGTAHVAAATSVRIQGLVPGTITLGHTRHVRLRLTNPDGTTTLGKASVTVTLPTGCPAGSFAVAQANTAIGSVPGHTVTYVTNDTQQPTITFVTLPVTQNACTGPLHFRVFTSS